MSRSRKWNGARYRDLQKSVARRLVVRRSIEKKLRIWIGVTDVLELRGAEDGRLQEACIAHNKALVAAGLPPLSIHGLRRSFGTLAEWVEVPAGIVA